jgi:ABC-type uncharacterized transport system ATPase subunit
MVSSAQRRRQDDDHPHDSRHHSSRRRIDLDLRAAEHGSRILNNVGYLPEERGLYKKMQVRRVLLFLAELKGIGPSEAAKRIDQWLERFQPDHRPQLGRRARR